MKEPAPPRLTLALSLLALAMAAFALVLTFGEPQARAAAAPSRDEALVAEVESLRGEIDSLRSSLERVAVGSTSYRVPQEEVASADAAPRPPLDASALPPDDGGFLLRTKLLHDFHQLDGKDREDALKELAELARWGDKEALALITESLSDPSSDVRARALRELDEVDRQNLAAHLERMIADTSGKVREIVADRLSKLPESEAGPMLLGLLRDRDKDVVMAAIRSIDDLNYAAARPLLTQQLGAENLDVATRAALTLRKLGDDGATAAMIERVVRDFSAGDVSTRIDNVKRLRRLHAQVQLTGILDSDPSLAVREAAREALAKLED